VSKFYPQKQNKNYETAKRNLVQVVEEADEGPPRIVGGWAFAGLFNKIDHNL
jgi:hypothetical protein